MSVRDEILMALTKHNRHKSDPHGTAVQLLAQYDAEQATLDADRLYRDAYTLGRLHADGADGRLRDFTPVWTTSDGTDVPATELRNTVCGCLVQGVGPKHLLDLNAMAAQHDCQADRKDGAA